MITDGFRPAFDAVTADLAVLVGAIPAENLTDLISSAGSNRQIREAWGRVEDTIRTLARLY